MAKVKFLGRWFLNLQKMLNEIPDLRNPPWAYLLIAYNRNKYRKSIGEFLMKLDQWEKDNNDIREIDIDLKINYRNRTLDQNALMWALYEIEAKEQNGGMVGSESLMVTPMELYLADLENWGEKDMVQTTVSRLHYYFSTYRIVRILWNGVFHEITSENKSYFFTLKPDQEITLQTTRGTSSYNVLEMIRHIDGIFNRLTETVGICDVGDLKMYKEQFDKFKEIKGGWK